MPDIYRYRYYQDLYAYRRYENSTEIISEKHNLEEQEAQEVQLDLFAESLF